MYEDIKSPSTLVNGRRTNPIELVVGTQQYAKLAARAHIRSICISTTRGYENRNWLVPQQQFHSLPAKSRLQRELSSRQGVPAVRCTHRYYKRSMASITRILRLACNELPARSTFKTSHKIVRDVYYYIYIYTRTPYMFGIRHLSRDIILQCIHRERTGANIPHILRAFNK